MPFATETDACREYAWNIGHQRPNQAWILTNYDTWERNPHYHGPAQRHPEDDSDIEDMGLIIDREVDSGREWPSQPLPNAAWDAVWAAARNDDHIPSDDYIPF